MAQLSTKIEMYCTANGVASVDFTKDVMLQDDSDQNQLTSNLQVMKQTQTSKNKTIKLEQLVKQNMAI
jgi:hypothetical protein